MSSSSDQWVRMFWTRIQRSQNHLVSLQWLTILTGQGHISELLVVCVCVCVGTFIGNAIKIFLAEEVSSWD